MEWIHACEYERSQTRSAHLRVSVKGQCPDACSQLDGSLCRIKPMRQDPRAYLSVGLSGMAAYVIHNRGNRTRQMIETMLHRPHAMNPFSGVLETHQILTVDTRNFASDMFHFLRTNSTLHHPSFIEQHHESRVPIKVGTWQMLNVLLMAALICNWSHTNERGIYIL